MDNITQQLIDSACLKLQVIKKNRSDIEESIHVICKALSEGNKIILLGNGGSAADAQHIAAEFVGRFKQERRAFPAIALTTDTSILTAIANDYDFSKVFARQMEAWACPGDVVIAISTSGNSENIIEAAKVARQYSCLVVGLTGKDGGKLKNFADVSIVVPSNDTARIQECHITIAHIICDEVEKRIKL